VRSGPLPVTLHPLFWDHDPRRLDWTRDRDLVIARVLARGGLRQSQILRRRLGDAVLQDWFIRHEARGLSPAQVRFWELVLDLPKARADLWVRRARASVWENRHHR
jgi:hypothetical protein